jgi:hypothetical protein
MIQLLPASAVGKVLVGGVIGVAGSVILRPVLVGAVRLGLQAGRAARRTGQTLAGEYRKIHDEAVAQPGSAPAGDKVNSAMPIA